ncbi:uncharacterized protein ACR2FA_007928 [Aphomia sociella]
MEVVLYNSTVCRLCGEENDNGTLLYSGEVNNQNLCEVINTYLPIKVSDDGQLPRTICPGCTIQLEATVEFLNLIIKGQKILRELHQREKEYKKSLYNNTHKEPEIITENIVYEINTSNGVYQVEHPIALQIAGLDKPKRKRGRPPKKPKSPEELAQEEPVRVQEVETAKTSNGEEPTPGKRRRKTPTRFKEAVQGKELERIFKEEGVIDGEDSDNDIKPNIDAEPKVPESKEPEIIGHMEDSGELVVVIKGKGRGRPKGRMRATQSQCAECGAQFSCAGRYMSHVAQHVAQRHRMQQMQQPDPDVHVDRPADVATTATVETNNADDAQTPQDQVKIDIKPADLDTSDSSDLASVDKLIDNVMTSKSLPELDPLALPVSTTDSSQEELHPESVDKEQSINDKSHIGQKVPVTTEESPNIVVPGAKPRLKCNHCEKTFSTKQSKSLHIKAAHQGERAHVCAECGARFAYPRSLALHAVAHRRRARGYACDLCGKVLNHPSSVVYHKEAEHAGQRYVCNKCGKSFKHKQLLQRHQLVHSQLRPFTCKTCNASFKTKANLINHQLLHSGIKKFACEICKHRFAHKTSLTLHMRWHTGQKPFSCNVCGKSFTQKGNLSEHSRIHTGEKPYACALCPRRFTTSSQHRLHARRHAPRDRPYACARCPNKFASRAAWLAHQRREAATCDAAASGGTRWRQRGTRRRQRGTRAAAAEARRHRCADCGRVFAERWALAKHARRHTGERPYRCPHCPRAFADCSNLNKHKKQVHKQVSLLVNDKNHPAVTGLETETGAIVVNEVEDGGAAGAADGELEERVIYVTYDVDEPQSPTFHILETEQATALNDGKVLTTCELYSGPSLLVRHSELEQEPEPELEHEHELEQYEQLEHEELNEIEQQIVLKNEHMTVTDEQGNPLHFTMQDGTRLAITSVDGKSLQVVTQDGQTIPVEINGFGEEEVEEVESPETIVHQLSIQKSVDSSAGAPVTHYFTIV